MVVVVAMAAMQSNVVSVEGKSTFTVRSSTYKVAKHSGGLGLVEGGSSHTHKR